jgi:hypothetical protein
VSAKPSRVCILLLKRHKIARIGDPTAPFTDLCCPRFSTLDLGIHR